MENAWITQSTSGMRIRFVRRSANCRFYVAHDAKLATFAVDHGKPLHVGSAPYVKAVAVARLFRGQRYATAVEGVERPMACE